jgi:hypothetical protein
MSSQMLFRVRHLIDKNMFICTPRNSKSVIKPITNNDIDEMLICKIIKGSKQLEDINLEYDAFLNEFSKDDYYKQYRDFIKKQNISNIFFTSYIESILNFHGINVFKHPISDDQLKTLIKQQFYEANIEIKKEEIIEIISATPIDEFEYDKIVSNKSEKTRQEQLSIHRRNITYTFALDYAHVFDITDQNVLNWLQTNIKHISGFYHYNIFFPNPIILNAIEMCIFNHEN